MTTRRALANQAPLAQADADEIIRAIKDAGDNLTTAAHFASTIGDHPAIVGGLLNILRRLDLMENTIRQLGGTS